MNNDSTTIAESNGKIEDWINRYILDGIKPVPLPGGWKYPKGIDGWQTLDLRTEDISRYFPEYPGCGALLGPAGMAAIDPDTKVAQRIFPYLLRMMDAETLSCGRDSAPRSKYFYRVEFPEDEFPEGPVAIREQYTVIVNDAAERKNEEAKERGEEPEKPRPVVELLAENRHALIPPTVHPSGEKLEWDGGYDPAKIKTISAARLQDIVKLGATAAALAMAMPPNGLHDIAGPLAGFLRRGDKLSYEDCRLLFTLIWKFGLRRPDDHLQNAIAYLDDTEKNLSKPGAKIAGGPTLDKEMGGGVLDWFSEFWGLDDNDDNDDNDFEELPDAVEFPVEVFPPYTKRYVTEATNSLGTPTDFVASAVLAQLSGAIGNSRVAAIRRDWIEGANLYLMIVAGVAQKKTPTQKAAFKPARRRQADLRKTYTELKEKYEEAQKNKKEDPDRARDAQKPVMGRNYVDDSTVEKLCSILNENPRGLLMVKDELSGWLAGMDQYKQGGKGNDRQFWLSAHTRSHVVVDRKNTDEPVFIPEPFITVWGGIQPDVLGTFDNDRGDGLIERFLVSYPEAKSSRWVEDEITLEAESAYERLVKGLYNLQMPTNVENGEPFPSEVKFEPAAKALFIDHYNDLAEEAERPGTPKRLVAILSKLQGHTLRFALVLALARVVEGQVQNAVVDEVITEEDMRGAITLAAYYRNHGKRLCSQLGNDNVTMKTEKLAADFYTYIVSNGGVWEGKISSLYTVFSSPYKPGSDKTFSTAIRKICKKSPALRLEDLQRTKDARTVRISLSENSSETLSSLSSLSPEAPEPPAVFEAPDEDYTTREDYERGAELETAVQAMLEAEELSPSGFEDEYLIEYITKETGAPDLMVEIAVANWKARQYRDNEAF